MYSGLVGEECQKIPGAPLGMSESCQPRLAGDPAPCTAPACLAVITFPSVWNSALQQGS